MRCTWYEWEGGKIPFGRLVEGPGGEWTTGVWLSSSIVCTLLGFV